MSKYEELERKHEQLCAIVETTAAAFQLTGGEGTCLQLAQGVLETVEVMKTQEKETERLRYENKRMEEKVYGTAGLLNVPDLSQPLLVVAEKVRVDFTDIVMAIKRLAKLFGVTSQTAPTTKIIRSVEAAAQQAIKQIHHSQQEVNELKKERDRLKQKVLQYEKSSLPKKAKDEIAKERHRYNDLLGLRIRQDPRFQDLNDTGRPELVTRKFQDICNQERLDAADELEKEGVKTDMETLQILSNVMQKSWEVAKSIIDGKQKKVSRVLQDDIAGASSTQKMLEVGEGMRLEILHELKAKDRAPFVSMIYTEVKKLCVKKYPIFGRERSDVEKFTKACGEVAWMIVLAIPSMTLDTPSGVAFDSKRHVLFPECRVQEGALITKCLWPALRFTSQQAPEVKAHVFTEIPKGRKPFARGRLTTTLRSLAHDASKYTNGPSSESGQQGNKPESEGKAQGTKPASQVKDADENTEGTKAAEDHGSLATSEPEKEEEDSSKQKLEVAAEQAKLGGDPTSNKEGVDCSQAELEVETQELTRVTEEKETTRTELTAIRAELERPKQELQNLQGKVPSENEELSNEQPNVDAKKEDAAHIKSNTETAKEMFEVTTKESEAARVELQTTKDELVKVKRELDSAKKALESVTSEVEGATQKLDSLKQETAATSEELSTMNSDVEAKKMELSDTTVEAKAANEKLQTMKFEQGAATEELSVTKSDTDTAKQQLTAVQTDLKKAQEHLSTLQKETETLEADTSARKQESEKVKKELTDVKHELEVAKDNLVSMESKIKAAGDQLTDLNGDIAAAKQKLNEISNSAETVKQEQEKQNVAESETGDAGKELEDTGHEVKSEAATEIPESTQTADDRNASMPVESSSGEQMVSLSSAKGDSSAKQGNGGEEPGENDAEPEEENDTRLDTELVAEDDLPSTKHKVQAIQTAMERTIHELAVQVDEARCLGPGMKSEQGGSLGLEAQMKKMQTELEELKSSPAIAREDDRGKLLTCITKLHDELKIQETKLKEHEKKVTQLKQDREEHDRNYICLHKDSLNTTHTTSESPSAVEMRASLSKGRAQKQRPESSMEEVQNVVTKFRSLMEGLRQITLTSLQQGGVDGSAATDLLSFIMQVSVSMAKGVQDLDKTDKHQQLEKRVTDHFSKREGTGELGLLRDFLKACVEVSLLMVDSSPQFELFIPTGGHFDDSKHECGEGSASEGEEVSQCLWPGLHLGSEDSPKCKAIVATFGSF